MSKLIYWLGIFILFVGFVHCEDETENEISFAVELNADNFDETIQKYNNFIMFYAPWCGHCKRLHPLWEQLAESMNANEDLNLKIGKVDCTLHQALCSKHEVTGYPTLRFFKLGESASVKFKGTRLKPAITEFIHEQLNAGKASESAEVGEEEPATEKPSVYELNESNFAQHVSSGNHFVKFYAPWCSHCQRLAPTWEKVGESFRTEDSVVISKIDCTVNRPICQDFEVKGYPTLLWIEDGKKIEKYSGSREQDALETYVRKMMGKSEINRRDGPASLVKDEKEDEATKLLPVQLNSENFLKNVESGVTFVKFYAPWCGHCQKLNPIWDQLAAKLHSADSGIKIAKVDCTENDNKSLCNEQQVEGYPTLFAYKNGVRQNEYGGGRSLSDLQHYITNILGHTEL